MSVVSWPVAWVEPVGRRQAVDRDDLRDDRVHRREEQGVGDAEDDAHHDQVPQLGAAGQGEAGQDPDGHATGDVRDEHQAPRREAVGQAHRRRR